jgi:hypothetical protein
MRKLLALMVSDVAARVPASANFGTAYDNHLKEEADKLNAAYPERDFSPRLLAVSRTSDRITYEFAMRYVFERWMEQAPSYLRFELFWAAASSGFQRLEKYWQDSANSLEYQSTVDTSGSSVNIDAVKPATSLWGKLLLKLKSAVAKERGLQRWLASELGVTPQAVNRWLSGDAAPNAEFALRLNSWIERGGTKRQTP